MFAQILPEQNDILESLPVSLSYEIASPSAVKTEPRRQAKAAVLDGEVKTLKEYRELVAKLESAESPAEESRQRAEKAEADYETIRDTLESIEEQPKVERGLLKLGDEPNY